MKFVADEDVAQIIIKVFRSKGHDILDVKKEKKRRLSDIEIARLAEDETRVVITHDKDYLTLLDNPRLNFKLIFIRVIPPSRENMIIVANYVLKNEIWEKMERSVVVSLIENNIFISQD